MPSWYAVAHPGLEPVIAAELAEEGIVGRELPGGVRFTADVVTGIRLASRLRTPDRLLVEMVDGPARTPDELAALIRKVDWKPFLDPQSKLDVHATAHESRLHFKESVQKKVTWCIGEALKGPRIPDARGRPRMSQRVQVRLDADRATVSIDAGGELLHRRGWRTDISKAPLRENLAACVLRLAEWDGQEALVDPFCGSGTLAIEAALMAAKRSPFVGRTLACTEWPANKPAAAQRGGWQGGGPPGNRGGPPGAHYGAPHGDRRGQRGDPRGPRSTGPAPSGPPSPVGPAPLLWAADRDPAAITAATANALRARVDVKWNVLDVGDLQPPAPGGLCIANPPWGLRLGASGAPGPDAGAVLARFGKVVRERFSGWRIVFLAPSRDLAERVHRDVRPIVTFPNGGIRVTVWRVDL